MDDREQVLYRRRQVHRSLTHFLGFSTTRALAPCSPLHLE